MPLHENTIGAHLPFERGELVHVLHRHEPKGGVQMFSCVLPHQGAVTAAEPDICERRQWRPFTELLETVGDNTKASPGGIGAGRTSTTRRWTS